MAGILIASDSVDDALLKTLYLLKESGTPVILFDYNLPQVTGLPGVFFDYEKGVAMATEYLLENGHTKIAFAAGGLDRMSRKMRYDSFKAALLRKGVPFPEKYLLVSEREASFEAGVEMAEQLMKLEDRPTAVIGINDTVACGILHYLVENHVSVPNEMSVIGFDNLI